MRVSRFRFSRFRPPRQWHLPRLACRGDVEVAIIFAGCNQTAHFSTPSGTAAPEVALPSPQVTGCPAWVAVDALEIQGTGNGVEHNIFRDPGDGTQTETFTGTVTITAYTADSAGNPGAPTPASCLTPRAWPFGDAEYDHASHARSNARPGLPELHRHRLPTLLSRCRQRLLGRVQAVHGNHAAGSLSTAPELDR
jgi:hypothetical protein